MPGLLNMDKLARSGDHQIQQGRPNSLPAMGLNSETNISRLMEEVQDQSSWMLLFSSAYRDSTHQGVSLPSSEEIDYALSLQSSLLAALQQSRAILSRPVVLAPQ
ncbi:hypothetical protein ASPFODRAFT_464994 [Aspergillus luchuensis CBS 106.47]|uniref:Uncharacterized protein n=1 Tax=Aspergillus luchuensis (strain CBS 106.47) TaxID=1137211 RepID=A0A1M3T093_ASPLC|nr:hypothetical protein ASPFODRAFT_464994 [Aspergillus luchuensis CBS 106.47]